MTERPLRADAVRSRQLLLDAAAEVFAQQGTEASISEIAHRAGLGKGTVFRHFSTKEDLLAAIMGTVLDQLISTGHALTDADDPAQALFEFMTAGVELLARDRAFCEVVGQPSLRNPDVLAGIDRLVEVAEKLAGRARAAGAIRADLTGRDVALLLAGVQQTAAPLADSDPQLWRRYLALVFDGIRAVNAPPLTHPAPDDLQFAAPT